MKLAYKITIGGVSAFVALFAGVFAGVFYYSLHPFTVGANPSFAGKECYMDGGTNATTTFRRITAGTATTTIGHDSLCDFGSSNGTIPSALNLILQHSTFTANASWVDIDIETSFDGKQWSREPYSTFVSTTATTSREFINPNYTRRYMQTASTTEILTGTVVSTTTITIKIPNPDRARYMKVYLTAPIGSQASNVWAKLVPIKEN